MSKCNILAYVLGGKSTHLWISNEILMLHKEEKMCSSSVLYQNFRDYIFTPYKSLFGNSFNITQYSTSIYWAPTLLLVLFIVLRLSGNKTKTSAFKIIS